MIQILVADDEEMIRSNFIKRINRLNIPISAIFQAGNGVQAMKILKEQTIQIALLDINMPFKNGLDLLAELKACSCDTRFIIISGYDSFQYAAEAIRYGVYRYLLKPINRVEFEEAVTSLYEIIRESQGGKTHSPVLGRILTEIDHHFRDPDYSLIKLSQSVQLSDGYITKLLKKEIQTTFSDYLIQKRIEAAKQMIRSEGSLIKLYEVADAVGYKNQHYFSQVFKKVTGMTPKEFSQKGYLTGDSQN